MEKMRKGILFGVVASESIHIFCCVLPTIFSIMSLLAGMGMIAVMPGFIEDMHHMIHDYEIPMIIASGVILAIGWALYTWSTRMNCSEEKGSTCCHEPCAPKKDRTKIVMMIATVLFIVNVSVYFGFHRANDIDTHHDSHQIESHHDHDHHIH